MTISSEYTPLSRVALAPIRAVAADAFDLPGNDSRTILDQQFPRSQAVFPTRIGARPDDGVRVTVESTRKTERGETSETVDVESTALTALDEPVDAGPAATERLQLEVSNRSGQDYTTAAAGVSPYQTFTEYEVRQPTVLDKLRRNIPLTQREQQLAEQFDLSMRERLHIPLDEGDYFEPTLSGKSVIETDAETATLDLPGEGATAATPVVNETVRGEEVLYVTGVRINGDDYAPSADPTVVFTRGETDEFYRLKASGLPSNPFEADLHLPFLRSANVAVYAESSINAVDVVIETARVRRNLPEKALYGLKNEVQSNDSLSEQRARIYTELRERLRAGVSIQPALDRLGDATTSSTPATRPQSR